MHFALSNNGGVLYWQPPPQGRVAILAGDALIVDWKRAPPSAHLQLHSVDVNAEKQVRHVVEDFHFVNGEACASPPQAAHVEEWLDKVDKVDEVDDDDDDIDYDSNGFDV